MVGKLADVMDEADVEYSIRLTRLVDGEATYTLTTSLRDGPLEFPSNEDASNYVQGLRRQAKVRAVLLALRESSEGMIEAGRPHMPHNPNRPPLDEHLGNIFTAMIDAALKEGDGE